MDYYLNEMCDLQNNDVCTIYTLKLNVQEKRVIEFLFLFQNYVSYSTANYSIEDVPVKARIYLTIFNLQNTFRILIYHRVKKKVNR